MRCALCHGSGVAITLLGIWSTVIPQAQAGILVVPEGTDYFSTPSDNKTWIDIGLPSGFFGSKGGTPSDAFSEQVFFHGKTAGLSVASFVSIRGSSGGEDSLSAAHAPLPNFPETVFPFDTAIFRQGTTLNNIGDSATVNLQIQILSLQTINPIEVTYGGGSPSFYSAFVDLDPGSTQMIGSATLTRTGETSGTFTSILPVTSRLTFTGALPTDPDPAFQPVHTDIFQGSGDFSVAPEPSTLMALAFGGLALLIQRRFCHRNLSG